MKTLLLLAACAVLLIALPACHTMQGFGEDISALGQSISNASDSAASGHTTAAQPAR